MKVKKTDNIRAWSLLPWLLGQPQPWRLLSVLWHERHKAGGTCQGQWPIGGIS